MQRMKARRTIHVHRKSAFSLFQGPFPLDKTGERHALEKHPHVLIQLPPKPPRGASAFPFTVFCPVQTFHRRDMPLQMLKHFIHTNDVRGFRKRIASLGPACGTQNARRAQDTYDLLKILDGNAFLAGDFRQLDTGPRRPSRQIDQKTEPVSGCESNNACFPPKGPHPPDRLSSLQEPDRDPQECRRCVRYRWTTGSVPAAIPRHAAVLR